VNLEVKNLLHIAPTFHKFWYIQISLEVEREYQIMLHIATIFFQIREVMNSFPFIHLSTEGQ
jgi:hypothetical protein